MSPATGQTSSVRWWWRGEQWLGTSLESFRSIDARHEVARTLVDLARLAGAAGRRDRAAARFREALTGFEALRVPRYVEQCRKLAVELQLGAM